MAGITGWAWEGSREDTQPTPCSGRVPQSSCALSELGGFCTDPEQPKESLCCPCCWNPGSSQGVRGESSAHPVVVQVGAHSWEQLLPFHSSCLSCAWLGFGLVFPSGSPEQTFPVIKCPAGFKSDKTTGSESGQEENRDKCMV